MDRVWLKSYPQGVPAEIEPSQFSSLVDLFEQICHKHASRNAITNMSSSLTYEQLERKSKHFAAYLQQECQLKKGERFAIMLPNTLQYYVAMFGAMRAGLVIVNVNPLYTHHELEHQLNDAGVSAIIVLENFAHTLEKALPNIKVKHVITTAIGDLFPFPKSTFLNLAVKYLKRAVPSFSIPDAIAFKDIMQEGTEFTLQPISITQEDTAFLQYTGGTTGPAKGAILSHGNMLANVHQSMAWLHNDKNDEPETLIAPLPLYHILSLTLCCFVMMELGGEVVLITNPRDLDGMVKTMAKTKYTWIAGINALYNALLHHPQFAKQNFSQLKLCLAGGAATSASVANDWRALTGKFILEGYGLTEASPVVTLNPLTVTDFNGSIGLPLPSTLIDIRDDDGNPVGIEEVGELWVKGPQVMQGYWQKPEETANVFSEDGWLKTGDMARMDEQGFLYIVERKKDMVLVSGFNVYPNEIREVLMTHPGIKEAAVIGVPSTETGEQVKAIVVKKDKKLTEENIRAHCKEYLTNYKRPKIIEFVNELPKTPVGKVLRRKLREQHHEQERQKESVK